MNLKKRVAAGTAAFLTAVLLAVPAYAHGSGHHSYVQSVQPVQTYTCPVEGCHVTGTHTHHNGVTHTGGYVCDGSCAALCTVEGCTVVGRHTHDGATYYCGYDHESGFCDGSCVALCAVEGCTTAGRHTHNGVTYCGNHHESGFCNGACTVAAVQQPTPAVAVVQQSVAAPAATATVRGHHGSGHHGCH